MPTPRHVCLGALAAVALAVAVPAAAPATVVLQDGHVDYGARLIGGRLRAQVKDGTAGTSAVVWREPADVVFHARPASRTAVPSNAAFAFLGAPGAPLWLLPQVQRPGLLWPGWNTEEIAADQLIGPLTWRLDAVDGPGRFALFTSGTFGGATTLFDSGDGLPDSATVPAGTHAHGNWAFSAEGRYALTFTTVAALAPSGGQSDTQRLVVTVGDVDPETGAPLPPAQTPPGGTVPTGGTGTTPPATQPPASDPGASGDRGRASRLTLTVSKPRLRGRVLTLRVRLGRRGRLHAVVLGRGGRALARGGVRGVPAGARAVRIRLTRRVAPGRHRVRLTASAAGRTVTRTVLVRAAARKP